MLHGAIFGLGSQGSAGATIGGRLSAPRAAGTVVIAGGRYRDFDVNGNAGLAYANGTLDVHDAAMAIGPLFVGVAGTVGNLSPQGGFAPRYDLAAQLHSSDVSTLVAAVAPQKAALVQGSIDADLHVRGGGTAPSFAGIVSAPEGSVNGLSFRDFAGGVSGDADGLSLSGGRVVIGSTAIGLRASADRAGAADVALDAPRADLADFNDFFDTGDTFAGTGSLALAARVGRNARAEHQRQRELHERALPAYRPGHGRRALERRTAARSRAPYVSAGLRARSRSTGSVAPASRSVNLRADARRVDLATWLPMLGYDVPITGRLDAQTTLAGIYPDIAMRLHAALFGATAGRMTIERFDVTASAAHGRGTIESATLDLPSMTTTASGTFGVRASDALALVATSTSPNLGEFLREATGTQLRRTAARCARRFMIEGTRAAPRLRDAIALQNLTYRNLTIPRVAGEIDADRQRVAVRNGEVDLATGRALIAAALPVRAVPTGVSAGKRPDLRIARCAEYRAIELRSSAPEGDSSQRTDRRSRRCRRKRCSTAAARRVDAGRRNLQRADGTLADHRDRGDAGAARRRRAAAVACVRGFGARDGLGERHRLPTYGIRRTSRSRSTAARATHASIYRPIFKVTLTERCAAAPAPARCRRSAAILPSITRGFRSMRSSTERAAGQGARASRTSHSTDCRSPPDRTCACRAQTSTSARRVRLASAARCWRPRSPATSTRPAAR